MNSKHLWGDMRGGVISIALAAISVIAFAQVIAAQEVERVELGKVQQGLVGGETVPVNKQEEFGLLILMPSKCSASLLRNDWVITAAHCVEVNDAKRNPIPDRARPGQNVINNVIDLDVEANWGGDPAKPGQKKKVVRLETFRPYDIALIKLASPFTVNGTTAGYNRPIWKDQYPHFGQLVPIPIVVFGRGVNQFATADGSMPSVTDGKYRVGFAKTSREGTDYGMYLYWYPSQGGLMVAGGDSGGPSFAQLESGRYALIGVHAMSHAETAPGKPKGDWDWVTATTEAADAPVKHVWDQLSRIMGPMPAPAAKVESPPPFTGRHSAVFETTVPFNVSVAGDFNILYGINQAGILVWHRHIINNAGGALTHRWNPTQNIGNGWTGLKDVLPAGQSAIYALKDNGELNRYWHEGAFTGSYKWGDGPQTVGIGWTTFSHLIPTDSGVIYGTDATGILRWNRNPHYADSGGSPNLWANSVNVGRGWTGFDKIFSGGKGVLYVVNSDGKLMWFKHKAYLNAVAMPGNNATDAQQLAWQSSWEGPKHVGTGWTGFIRIFSPGDGHIYGIKTNGDLMWYRHVDWAGGSARWDSRAGVKIAGGWDSYVFAFARSHGNDPGHDVQ